MKNSLFLVIAALGSLPLTAQKYIQQVDAGPDTSESRWYSSPWIWIIGAAIFILLLVVLPKNEKKG